MLKAIALVALRGLHPSGTLMRVATLASALLGGLAIFTSFLGLGFAAMFQADFASVAKQYQGEFKAFVDKSWIIPASTEARFHQVCEASGIASAVVSARTEDAFIKLTLNHTELDIPVQLMGIGKVSGTPPSTFVSGQLAFLHKGCILADWTTLGIPLPPQGSEAKITMGDRVISLVTSGNIDSRLPMKQKVLVLTLDDLDDLLSENNQQPGPNITYIFAKSGADSETASKALGALMEKSPETASLSNSISYWKSGYKDAGILEVIQGLWIIVWVIVLAISTVCFTFAVCNILSIRRGHQDADLAFTATGLSPLSWPKIAALRGGWLGILSIFVAFILTAIGMFTIALAPNFVKVLGGFKIDGAVFLASFILVSTSIVAFFVIAGLVAEWLHRRKLPVFH